MVRQHSVSQSVWVTIYDTDDCEQECQFKCRKLKNKRGGLMTVQVERGLQLLLEKLYRNSQPHMHDFTRGRGDIQDLKIKDNKDRRETMTDI